MGALIQRTAHFAAPAISDFPPAAARRPSGHELAKERVQQLMHRSLPRQGGADGCGKHRHPKHKSALQQLTWKHTNHNETGFLTLNRLARPGG